MKKRIYFKKMFNSNKKYMNNKIIHNTYQILIILNQKFFQLISFFLCF